MSIITDPRLARVPKEKMVKGLLTVGAGAWGYIDIRPPQGRLWLVVDIRLYLPANSAGSGVYANVREAARRYLPPIIKETNTSPMASFNGQIYISYDLWLELRSYNTATSPVDFGYVVSVVEL